MHLAEELPHGTAWLPMQLILLGGLDTSKFKYGCECQRERGLEDRSFPNIALSP